MLELPTAEFPHPVSAHPPTPKLGVGLLYQEELRPFIESRKADFDFLEVIPDLFWHDLGPGKDCRYVEDQREIGILKEMNAEVPMVLHSIGLSIGSAHRFDREHISQIARWTDLLDVPWHSDHLAFMLAQQNGGSEVNVGVTLPLPYDEESLDLVVPRSAEICQRIKRPFLLENNVYFFEYANQALKEATFLNQLCERSGCRLLLDLHNLYTNSRNQNVDSYAFLEQLNLDNVVEIHVAGGLECDGFYQDAHSDTSPPPVWEMLDWALPRCRNVGGIVFELLGSWYGDVGEDRLVHQLSRMKDLWMRHQQTPERNLGS